tara:strand:+ start:7081 stop:7377 length:297 start_codon:yes stop_codon:yes gene_type:complete
MYKYNKKWVVCDKCQKKRKIPFNIIKSLTHFEMCDWSCEKNYWDSFNKCEMYEESDNDTSSEYEIESSESSYNSDNDINKTHSELSDAIDAIDAKDPK